MFNKGEVDIMSWIKTSCCLCLQGCGLEVLTKNNRIVKVRPDKANLRSKGYACRKGLKIAHFQHHRQRLDHPLKRQSGTHVRLGWDETLTDIRQRLGEILENHGPRSVAMMAGGSGGCQIGGRFSGRLLMGLGSRYVYTALGQEWTGRHHVRGRVYGHQPLFLHPDHDQLDLLFGLGWNGWSSHGIPQTRRYLKALSEDPDRILVVVDPRPSETAKYADFHLALTPGSDALLLKAMIGIILEEGWQDASFLESHTTGWEKLAPCFTADSIRAALEVCALDHGMVREVCRLFASRKSAVMSDLGVLMNRHSTLVSYLEEILLAVCGRTGAAGGNVATGTLSPIGIDTPPEDPNTWRTMKTDIPAIMGVFPPNVLPEEIDSDRDDRIRALIVVGTNPLRSFADTRAYERAFKKLDLLVVLDVAMTETAQLADYVLPGRTAYESHDTTFWSFDYPEIFFHLRRPVVEPALETRENGWIISALAEKLGLLPDIPESLSRAAEKDRTLFSRELKSYVISTPGANLMLPFILAKTLGPVLGSSHLSLLWGLLWSAPEKIKEAMERVGFTRGEDQADLAFNAVMEHPEGIWLGRMDPERGLDFVATDDRRLHLYDPELAEWLGQITPELETAALSLDETFPMILMAGWHYDSNANTMMRDPAWNKGRRVSCLAVHPEDAAALDITDGESVKLTTQAATVTVEAQISKLTRPGMVLLPQGFGLDFDGGSVGVNVNLLTPAGNRDRIAATPYHRRVPCRLQKLNHQTGSYPVAG
jgi:anaerobic selenocysteine-containing dehydrogenase